MDWRKLNIDLLIQIVIKFTRGFNLLIFSNTKTWLSYTSVPTFNIFIHKATTKLSIIKYIYLKNISKRIRNCWKYCLQYILSDTSTIKSTLQVMTTIVHTFVIICQFQMLFNIKLFLKHHNSTVHLAQSNRFVGNSPSNEATQGRIWSVIISLNLKYFDCDLSFKIILKLRNKSEIRSTNLIGSLCYDFIYKTNNSWVMNVNTTAGLAKSLDHDIPCVTGSKSDCVIHFYRIISIWFVIQQTIYSE